MANYSMIIDRAVYEQASALARGPYQQALLDGSEDLSGATLRGKAAKYGARYAASRRSFLARVAAAGLPVSEQVGDHGKRILVIGDRG